MDELIRFLNFLQVLIAVILTVVAGLLNGIRKHLADMKAKMEEVNNKLIEIDTWKQIHDETCKDKHDDHHATQRDLWQQINEVRAKINNGVGTR